MAEIYMSHLRGQTVASKLATRITTWTVTWFGRILSITYVPLHWYDSWCASRLIITSTEGQQHTTALQYDRRTHLHNHGAASYMYRIAYIHSMATSPPRVASVRLLAIPKMSEEGDRCMLHSGRMLMVVGGVKKAIEMLPLLGHCRPWKKSITLWSRSWLEYRSAVSHYLYAMFWCAANFCCAANHFAHRPPMAELASHLVYMG